MKKANMWEAFARYEDLAQVAAFLEAEWSDCLFRDISVSELIDSDPMTSRAAPSFYQRVATLFAAEAIRVGLVVESCCDIGGATGRLLNELKGHFPDAREWMLVEPSGPLCAWAERILLKQPHSLTIPTVGAWSHPDQATVPGFASRFTFGRDNVQILQSTLEELPQHHSGFDLLICCNVLDRCDNPQTFVNMLSLRIRAGGLLLLSSPLEFDLRRTGEIEQDDLKAFALDEHWKILSNTDERYDLRVSTRKWVRYSSQVLILQRLGGDT